MITRTQKAIIAIAAPVAIVASLKYIHPASYESLMVYMVGVVLVFKTSLISMWLASKLKMIAFLKSLTLFQGFVLTLKRWLLDNVVADWIKTNISIPLSSAFSDIKQYYSVINWKAKVRNFMFVFIPITGLTAVLYWTNILSHIALFAEMKVLVIGFFKAMWVLIAQFGGVFSGLFAWLAGSWLAPVLEVFALSYILTWLEKKFGKNNPLSRFFNWVSEKLNKLLFHIGILNQKHLDPVVDKTVGAGVQKMSSFITSSIKGKKTRMEYLYFENLRNIMLQGHIDAYYHFKDMGKLKDKVELYTRINKETQDNIDIIGYVSRDHTGQVLKNDMIDSYHNDIFIMTGIASNRYHGVKEDLMDDIDYTDFWVMNTSKHDVYIESKSRNFNPQMIDGNQIILIKTDRVEDVSDIVFNYKSGVSVEVTPVKIPEK